MESKRAAGGPAPRDSVASRSELQALKERALANPESLELRLELASAYRLRGFPDQAARWGILTDGWATEIELDRLARALASSGVGSNEVRSYLMLPPTVELPPSIAALLEHPTAKYRKQFGASRRFRGHEDTPGSKALGNLAGVLSGVSAVGSILTLVVVYVMALAGVTEVVFFARVTGTVVLLSLITALALVGIRGLIRRRHPRAR